MNGRELRTYCSAGTARGPGAPSVKVVGTSWVGHRPASRLWRTVANVGIHTALYNHLENRVGHSDCNRTLSRALALPMPRVRHLAFNS